MKQSIVLGWVSLFTLGLLGCGSSSPGSLTTPNTGGTGGALGGAQSSSGAGAIGGALGNGGATNDVGPSTADGGTSPGAGATGSALGGAQSSSGVGAIGGALGNGGATNDVGPSTADGGTSSAAGGGTASGGSNAIGGVSGAQGGTTGSATGGNVSVGGNSSTASGGSAPASTPVDLHGQLSVSGTHLLDESGNPVQLKGPSAMWLNWENDGFASDKATVQWMRDNWGAKIVRAAMGVSTTQATDPDYLMNPTEATRRLRAVVDNAISLGMYVIIDWHDSAADQHQTQAVSFFTQMAQTYGSSANVIYETFNEPINQAWSTVIKPYHQAVVDAIRQYDPDNVIILGTRTYSQRPDEAAADPVTGTNLMYALHFYSCTHGASIRASGDAALARGAPVFVSEWGATAANGGTGTSAVLCLDEARLWNTWMNTNQISWCAWKLDNCTDLSCYFTPTTALAATQAVWTDSLLNGHAPFVRGCMQGNCP